MLAPEVMEFLCDTYLDALDKGNDATVLRVLRLALRNKDIDQLVTDINDELFRELETELRESIDH